MHPTSILALVAFISSAAACFPENITSTIELSIGFADDLARDIDRQDNSTGRQILPILDSALAYLVDVITEDCDPPAPASWPSISAADSRIRAMAMLSQIEDGLNVLQRDVEACEIEAVDRVMCEIYGTTEGLSRYYDWLQAW